MSDKFCVGSGWKSNISLAIVLIHVKHSLKFLFLTFPPTATYYFFTETFYLYLSIVVVFCCFGQTNNLTSIYSTSSRSKRFLFRWYTNLDWNFHLCLFWYMFITWPGQADRKTVRDWDKFKYLIWGGESLHWPGTGDG